MNQVCVNCSAAFEVTEDDLVFLDRVSPSFNNKKYALPPPTHCPDCRQQRRMIWRNERNLFKRTCDFSKKEIISMYPPDSPFKVYEQDIWWSDKWNAQDFGRDFDFSKSFFEQFRALQLDVPRVALVNKNSENSHYTNHADKNKNCYLSGCTFESEDIYYSDWIVGHCRDCFDCSYMLEGCELCYETYYAWGSYNALFCEFIRRCRDVRFCFDCMNCKDCILCCNLRNKQYCIENVQYSAEEYAEKKKGIMPFSTASLKEYKAKYKAMKEQRAIHPATYMVQCEDCTGDLLFTSKNCKESYDSIDVEDCRYMYDAIDTKDSLDVYHVGWAEKMYECHAISNGYNCIVCHFTYDTKNAFYCDCTQNSHDLFGCVGMNQSSYCIFNKQYTKEEYEQLVPKIIEHMQKTDEWGEFFPLSYSPFGYNQSRAQEYYLLDKHTAQKKNIPWSDYTSPIPKAQRTIQASQLPEYSSDIPDDVLDWLIICEKTKKPFRIIRQELEFCKKAGLPLPSRHPDQRYTDRMNMRKPRSLWQRKCSKCSKQAQSSFSPDRPEKVYCEECYLAEVY